MLENMAFLVGGVLAGIMAKLPADFMNRMSLVILGSRVIYIVSYVNVTRQKWAPLRTVWYMASNLAVLAMYWKAGMVGLVVSFKSNWNTSAFPRALALSRLLSHTFRFIPQPEERDLFLYSCRTLWYEVSGKMQTVPSNTH